MPLHTGHLALISHGLKKCHLLTILMVYSSEDSIDPELRYSWLVDHYKKNSNVIIDVACRDSIDKIDQDKRTMAWCNFIKNEYPKIDCIVSSETYGDILATFMGIHHLKFDPKREIVPISATNIRNDHEKHIHFLPEHVRKFFIEGLK